MAVVLVGFMLLKAVVLWALARAIKLPLREQPVFDREPKASGDVVVFAPPRK